MSNEMDVLIEETIVDLLRGGGNHISETEALDASVIGLQMFDAPIVGYASADDGLFERFATEEAITNGRFKPPGWWLEGVRTVISFFFPFTDAVKGANGLDMVNPSSEWLHGRAEGQMMIDDFSRHLTERLVQKGFRAVAPSLDERFVEVMGAPMGAERPSTNGDYGSNWSERHVAYAAGLGTFGLSRGLITRKGVAGRFTSVITDMWHEPTQRGYVGVYDHCTMCGACARNCPAGAITIEGGKDHTLCKGQLDLNAQRYGFRYACGKCQVRVPCANGIPIATIPKKRG